MINHDERLIFLSTFIGVGELVRKWIDSKSTNQQPLLSLIFIRYIELIHSPFNNDDTNELILNLTYIRADLCKQNKFKYANERYKKICLLIKYMIDESYFKGGNVDGLSSLMCTLTELICAELAGDFHLGYARQLTDKSSLLFDLAF